MADTVVAALLMLADSRLPAGGHAHSGGVEAAFATGLVTDIGGLERFLRGRLRTAGLTAAALAAAAARIAGSSTVGGRRDGYRRGRPPAAAPLTAPAWSRLEAEADARTPSPAQREASRTQGRALLRAGRAAWPDPRLGALPGSPHHPVALGAVAVAAGCGPADAALVTAYLAVSGPATAAVRLRGFDPLAVHGLVAGLAADIEAVASRAAEDVPPAELPCPAAPRLDILAELHARAEVRLFAS
jgi:urease accessory protein